MTAGKKQQKDSSDSVKEWRFHLLPKRFAGSLPHQSTLSRSCCPQLACRRCLGANWFTERFHRYTLVRHFQHRQVCCTARAWRTTRSPAADFINARPRGDTQFMVHGAEYQGRLHVHLDRFSLGAQNGPKDGRQPQFELYRQWPFCSARSRGRLRNGRAART
jgi:hypothetical protein